MRKSRKFGAKNPSSLALRTVFIDFKNGKAYEVTLCRKRRVELTRKSKCTAINKINGSLECRIKPREKLKCLVIVFIVEQMVPHESLSQLVFISTLK